MLCFLNSKNENELFFLEIYVFVQNDQSQNFFFDFLDTFLSSLHHLSLWNIYLNNDVAITCSVVIIVLNFRIMFRNFFSKLPGFTTLSVSTVFPPKIIFNRSLYTVSQPNEYYEHSLAVSEWQNSLESKKFTEKCVFLIKVNDEVF